jgi:hypothetical protein
MNNVTITWKAFGKPTFAVIMVNGRSELQICEDIFEATNTRSGRIWDAIQCDIPADRTHTAISIGDEIDIDGTVYRCAAIGWDVVAKHKIDDFAKFEKIFDRN